MIIKKQPPYSSSEKDPDRTRAEIEKLLRDYGVSGTQWTTLYDKQQVKLSFIVEAELKGQKKQIAIEVNPPLFLASRRTWNPKGYYEKVYAPNWAQSFRMLFWWLKAKLEAVAYGLSTVEKEFLSQVVLSLADGSQRTVGDALTESIEKGVLQLEVRRQEPEIIESREVQ